MLYRSNKGLLGREKVLKLKTKKGKVIALASGAVVVAVGIIVAVMLQGKGYRSIIVEQTNGQVTVTGEKNNGAAYRGEKLYSGDNVSVGEASEMVMCMDMDKYVYADAGTAFEIEASSGNDDSRLKLNLTSGSELNELKSKLGPNDSYQVETPNATMSVRGTTFRVTVYKDGEVVYTLLEVTKGEVLAQLKNPDGTYNGEEQSFTEGQSALIRGFSEFIVGEENEKVLRLNYDILPQEAKERVMTLIQSMENDVIVGDVEAQEPKTADGENENEKNDKAEVTGADADAGDDDADAGDDDANAGDDSDEHVHTFGEWVIVNDSTCQATGLKQRVCTECNQVVETEKIPVKDHVPGEWVTYERPTCTLKGAEAQNCVYCNKLMATRDIPATGHSYADGKCMVCGESDPSYPEPAACNHDWHFDGSSGRDEWICSKCGAVVPGGPTAHP